MSEQREFFVWMRTDAEPMFCYRNLPEPLKPTDPDIIRVREVTPNYGKSMISPVVREMHYEKLWKEFCSIQSGDLQKMPTSLDRKTRALEYAKNILKKINRAYDCEDYLEQIEKYERGEA